MLGLERSTVERWGPCASTMRGNPTAGAISLPHCGPEIVILTPPLTTSVPERIWSRHVTPMPNCECAAGTSSIYTRGRATQARV
jgi:hypothetical protein